MIKIASNVKQLPTLTNLTSLNWYVLFIGTVNNLSGITTLLENTCSQANRLWVPTYQEYCKYHSHVILVDRLVYPGYSFIGFSDNLQLGMFLHEIGQTHKGVILGDGLSSLSKEEIQNILEISSKFIDTPKVMFDIKVGDQVIISSGPLTGLPATITELKASGNVTLRVFFLSRELTVRTSVLDIQSFGYAYVQE